MQGGFGSGGDGSSPLTLNLIISIPPGRVLLTRGAIFYRLPRRHLASFFCALLFFLTLSLDQASDSLKGAMYENRYHSSSREIYNLSRQERLGAARNAVVRRLELLNYNLHLKGSIFQAERFLDTPRESLKYHLVRNAALPECQLSLLFLYLTRSI